MLLRPFLEDLYELESQLYEWETSEDPISVAVKYWGEGYRNIEEYYNVGDDVRLELQFIEPLCNKRVERINKNDTLICLLMIVVCVYVFFCVCVWMFCMSCMCFMYDLYMICEGVFMICVRL